MTWVFAPLGYNKTWSFAFVNSLPISRCAMQWFTPIIGTFNFFANSVDFLSPTNKHGANPGLERKKPNQSHQALNLQLSMHLQHPCLLHSRDAVLPRSDEFLQILSCTHP